MSRLEESDGEVGRPAPLARHAVIQSDQFCPCGYNLFGQRVDRDERLGFEVVRCPECGRFSPAGHGTPSSRPWLRRIAAGMLALWVLLILAILGAAAMTLLGLYVAGSEAFLTYVQVERGTDQPVEYDGGYDPTIQGYPFRNIVSGQAVAETNLERIQVPYDHPVVRAVGSSTNTPYSVDGEPPPWAWPLLLGIGGLIGLGLGVLAAAFLWHLGWPRWLLLLLPAGVGATAWSIFAGNAGGQYRLVGDWYLTRIGVAAGVTAAGIAVGLVLGRRVARGLARLLVPPGPRQALAFLWHADGKELGR